MLNLAMKIKKRRIDGGQCGRTSADTVPAIGKMSSGIFDRLPGPNPGFGRVCGGRCFDRGLLGLPERVGFLSLLVC
jgi:hypothetical protein